MLRTEKIFKILKGSKSPVDFDSLWEKIKDEFYPSSNEKLTENQVKTDLYMTMLEDPGMIMIGSNKWDLKTRYSHDEQTSMARERITIETELNLEVTDDTKELKLEIVIEKED